MRAVTIEAGKVVVAEHPDPQPGDRDALIRVEAAGLNGADQAQLLGLYPPPPGAGVSALIPGLELAGEVLEVGRLVSRFIPGDRVMAIVAGAGQAELASIEERQLMPIPPELGWVPAGGFPETFITAYDALFHQADLKSGERLLVHGAAGGVGTAAVQLGAMAGAVVTATVRSPGNRDAVAGLGAHAVVDPVGFAAHGPFDVILDLVGASNLNDNLLALDTRGRIAFVGIGGGASAELNVGLMMFKRATISAASLRSRPAEEKAMLARTIEALVLPQVASGRLTVRIDSTFALSEVGTAYERFRTSGKLGKVILLPHARGVEPAQA